MSAQTGAEKVRNVSIEERTKRAMLAEAAADRMLTPRSQGGGVQRRICYFGPTDEGFAGAVHVPGYGEW